MSEIIIIIIIIIVIIFVYLRLSNATDNIRYKNRCRHIHGHTHNTRRLEYIYTHSRTVFMSRICHPSIYTTDTPTRKTCGRRFPGRV